jgi:hypothetical protein
MIASTFNARMLAPELYAVAHSASITMIEVLPPADAAQATLIAVEYLLLLRVVIEEVALAAEVLCNFPFALDAFASNRLARVAIPALHLTNGIPIHLVVGSLVMAAAASKSLVATRRDNPAAELVMRAVLSESGGQLRR